MRHHPLLMRPTIITASPLIFIEHALAIHHQIDRSGWFDLGRQTCQLRVTDGSVLFNRLHISLAVYQERMSLYN